MISSSDESVEDSGESVTVEKSEETDSTTLQCHHHCMETWKALYCKQDLSDVTLIVGKENVEFKAHRLVLAAHSDVMKRML